MKTTKMLTILVLALAPAASAAQSLTVNGEALDAITLKTGQACTVEVISDNSNPYSAYVGFDDRVVLGIFDQAGAMPEAGDLASITEYDVPSFYGYYVSAAGTSPPPSPGVHFIIEYEPQQIGETELKLYDPTRITVIATVHITVVAAQMGTVFTYQGRLMEAGNPADGQYDFEFMLYNAPSYGSQLAGTGEVNDLDVINGYFTVELDFGSDVFDGDAVWLEISVRPGDSNDPNAFVSLSPRQQITATPYSLQTRGIFVDKSENIGMGTTSPKGKLHVDGGKAKLGFPGTEVTIKAQDGGDGGGLIGDNGGAGGNIILLPGAGGEPRGFGRRGRDGNVGIGTAAPEAMLDVRGNIKVDQKIQAYDSGGLELATDEGTTRIFVEDGGKVGIGTTTPQASLEVTNTGSSHAIWASTSDIPVYAHRTATGGTWPAVAGDCNSQSSNASGVRGRILSTSPGSLGAGVYGYNYGTGSNGVGVRGHHAGSGYAGYFTGGRNYFEGNVGIGTTFPTEKLHVAGNLKVNGIITSGSGNIRSPIAYGCISELGEVLKASPNVSSSLNYTLLRYEITISGEPLGDYSHIFSLTYINVGAPRFMTGRVVDEKLIVEIWSPSGVNVSGRFHFIIYKI